MSRPAAFRRCSPKAGLPETQAVPEAADPGIVVTLTDEEGTRVMTIDYWRAEIDEIDGELLRLLNRRARLAMKVGLLKNAAGLPCCDPEREQFVLNRLQQANGGPLDNPAITRLFQSIIHESRMAETQVTEGAVAAGIDNHEVHS